MSKKVNNSKAITTIPDSVERSVYKPWRSDQVRKIIQLLNDHHDNVYAVCNDGSIWCLLGSWRTDHDPLRWERGEWPTIPQDENKEIE